MGSPTSFQTIPQDSALDYVRDAFNDFTNPANNNLGLTDTVLTNPTRSYFGNDNSPKYKAKTLWVKNVTLEEDRSKWVNGRPTYKIIWNETWPGAVGYITGELNSLNVASSGVEFQTIAKNDVFGVSGVIRRVGFLLQASSAGPISANILVDGVSSSSLTVRQIAAPPGFSQKMYVAYSNSANQTNDLHDYQLQLNFQAVPPFTTPLTIVGAIVYYENASGNVEITGGTTYVDKEPITTAAEASNIPPINSVRGGLVSFSALSNGSLGVTASPIPEIASIATGTNGTNQITVGTGLGGSFPTGSIVQMFGATTYVGNVLSVSTDTLTMGVTLAASYSATLSILAQAGPTFSIDPNLYETKFVADFSDYFPSEFTGYGVSAMGPVFSSPQLDYRVWGNYRLSSTVQNSNGGKPTIALDSNTTFVQVDGKYDALEFEFVGGITNYIHATFLVDGLPCFNLGGFNDSYASYRRTILANAGIGFHSVRLQRGSSAIRTGVSRIVGYRRKQGATLPGHLGDLYRGQTFIPYVFGTSATVTCQGNIRRTSPDSIEASSGWVSSVNMNLGQGGVITASAASSASMRYSYFGTGFNICGITTGGSFSLSVDGVPDLTSPMNRWTGLTLASGFHELVITPTNGATLIISAIENVEDDYIVNRQRFYGGAISGVNPQSIVQDPWGRIQVADNSIGILNKMPVPRGTSVGLGGLASNWDGSLQHGGNLASGSTIWLDTAVTITSSGKGPILIKGQGLSSAGATPVLQMYQTANGLDYDCAISVWRITPGRNGSGIFEEAWNTKLFEAGSAAGASGCRTYPATTVEFSDAVGPGVYRYCLGATMNTGTGFFFNRFELTAKEDV